MSAAMLVVVTGCGGGGGDRAESGPPVVATAEEWSQIEQAAKEEGSLIIYGSAPGVEETFKLFAEEYPEIDVTVDIAPTADLLSRLDMEISSGASGGDIYYHGQPLWFDTHSGTGELARYTLGPDAVAAGWEERMAGMEYSTMYAYPYLLAYNTQNAEPVANIKELVEKHPDARVGILSPRAAIAVAFQYDNWLQAYGPEVFDKLGQMEVVENNSNSTLSQGLAAGQFDYVIGMTPGTLDSLQASGAPVEVVVPDEYNAGPTYGLGSPVSAPHPNAAQLFLNWLISEKGQAVMIERHSPGSVPVDVPGSLPWGSVETYVNEEWPKERWDAWLADEWTSRFGS